MRLRTLGVAGAMVLAVLAVAPAALAVTHVSTSSSAQPTTLRGLAAQVGLRFGTAIIPFDLNTAALNQIAAQQFSVV
ncbi:MAG TPA: 1,4-beta-xylanase, partial [Candidatus Dormibacteraeota bacterium]|nr:1,4-beta-xylanase [Candidatus Dormibacteraeota bacterium]